MSDNLHPRTIALLRALAEYPGSSGEVVIARRGWIEAGRPDLPPECATSSFGELLARKRQQTGYSQRDLAAALVGVRGLGQGAIAKIERGEFLPDVGQAEALFTALGFAEEERREALRRAYGDRLAHAPVREVA